jgi:hypothetical protein
MWGRRAVSADLGGIASWRNNDPLDRVLGYMDFRKSILRGEAAEFTCLVGTMVQENQTPRSAMPAMPASAAMR